MRSGGGAALGPGYFSAGLQPAKNPAKPNRARKEAALQTIRIRKRPADHDDQRLASDARRESGGSEQTDQPLLPLLDRQKN